MTTEELNTKSQEETPSSSEATIDKESRIRRWVVLPICLVALNIFNKVILYKLELIENVYLRVFVILVFLITGFSLVGVLLTPAVERVVATILKGFGKAAGRAGVIIVGILIATSMYLGYLTVYTFGLETVLPETMLNPAYIKEQRALEQENMREALAKATSAGQEGTAEMDQATRELVEQYQRVMGIIKGVGYPALIGGIVLIIGLYLYVRRRKKKKKAKLEAGEAETPPDTPQVETQAAITAEPKEIVGEDEETFDPLK